MKKLLKLLTITCSLLFILYVAVCGYFYSNQESLIFIYTKLESNYQYAFKGNFEEINIKATDGSNLNSLLFKAPNSKGVIFYLHGNSGSLKEWGTIASFYTKLNYDLFIIDYRGFGKSEGIISSERELHDDIQKAYNELRKRYHENKIVVLGYSLGTGFASKLGSTNSPRMTILQAPHYNMTDAIHQLSNSNTSPLFKILKFIPVSLILKYPFRTDLHIQKHKTPLVIFHGDEDEQMYYGSSLKLQQFFGSRDELITLNKQGHLGFIENLQYLTELKRVLNE